MGILVVGSVAFDSIRTPSGYQDEILGGSATYFSVAASYFAPVSVIAVVGDDFPEKNLAFLRQKGIDLSGLQQQKGKTFRWKGEYGTDMNTARTLETQLNVFADFSPRLRSEHQSLEFLFLGNIDPDLQRGVLEQMKRPKIVACDTMNYWINHKIDSLRRILSLIDILLINDAEARAIAQENNLIRAGRMILGLGPKTVVIKRGEYGALMVMPKSVFAIPAYPLEEVIDPTGAGDSFAGGFMGYIAAKGNADEPCLRQAIVFGSVMASFTVSDFGPRRLGSLTFTEIEKRFEEFKELTEFGSI
jgi:sugar/nucleoside kinase (ribokinase family)